MIDIDKKLNKIEKNCMETAKKELKMLQDENNSISEEKISKQIDSYKIELNKKYEDELNRIKREYNKTVFDYEMDERRKISKFKESLINNIYNKVVKEFEDFVKSREYKNYLFNNIKETIEKVNDIENCTIYITEYDYYKFKQEIVDCFRVVLDIISRDNIGGCILINKREQIAIDNTLKNNIVELVSKITF